MRFSAGEAAFEGFRVTRHHPAALGAWALVSVLSILATALTALPILQPVATELRAMIQSMMAGAQSQPSAAMQAQMTYAMWATMPVSLVTQAVLLPALYRAMTTEGRDRFAFIRLGRDELRVLAVLVIIALISLVLNQIGEMAVTLTGDTPMAALGGLVSLLASVFAIYASVRLVLTSPATFATGQIDLKSGWRLTKGVFWSLLGMAIIAGVMASIVVLLLVIVALPVWSLVVGGAASAGGRVAALVILLLAGLGSALVMVILSAPFMAAYREISGASKD